MIITSVIALLAIATVLVIAMRSRLLAGPSLVGRTVVVHTRQPDDQSIRGVLHGSYADRWTLREAVLLTSVGEQAVGGLQHIPIASISWVQEIESTTGSR